MSETTWKKEPTLEIGMTPVDLIADLRSRINPAYVNQIGTESWERKLCADALEEQASAIDLLHSWEADAQARAGLLEQHLRAVLDVARVNMTPAIAAAEIGKEM